MSSALPYLPRLLLADGDQDRRAAIRVALAGQVLLMEVSRADEVLAALDAAGPAVTLLDHALPGARTAELVARILELCPAEAVLVLATAPQVEFYRACMRAGAYDCIDRESLAPTELLELCQSAAQRVAERARLLGATAQNAEEVVQGHEREAAARLVTAELLDCWGRADLVERNRLLADHVRLAQRLDEPTERDAALATLLKGLEDLPDAAQLLVGAHVHAVGSGRLDAANGDLKSAREALIVGLQALAARRTGCVTARLQEATSQPALPAASSRSSAVKAWHRWKLHEGQEEWLLVVDGGPLARLTVAADGCRAQLREGMRLVEVAVPALPAGLREVERRLGLDPVLVVSSLAASA